MKHLLLLLLVFFPSIVSAQARAIQFQGALYISLEDLLSEDFLDASVEMTYWGRNLVIDYDDKRVIYENGGDQLRDADGKTHYLSNPVLVIEDKHYVPVDESAEPLGYTIKQNKLEYQGKSLTFKAKPLLNDYPYRSISKMSVTSEPRTVSEPLSAYTMLPPEEVVVELQVGTEIYIRRTFLLEGEEWVLAAINGPANYSIAIRREDLDESSDISSFDGTHLDRLFKRAHELAELEQGYCHGDREQLKGKVSLTSDLCWSIRPYEKEFYYELPNRSADGSQTVYCTQFISGRWLQQQPLAMADLLELEKEPSIDFIWGLHSWDHPKSGIFMNAYAPESLRGDTLHLEKILLEWGVVPEHFYRFPGLKHDETRLNEILAMSLLPVDCDSWVSGMHLDRPPHRVPATNGSILLVHGNGNEARGISRFFEWLEEEPDWEFAPIWEFVNADVDQSALFVEDEEE